MSMNSGYSGWSRSKRAERAEDEGKLPVSRLAKYLKVDFPGITTADIKAVMEPCEWHHTSKYANATDYYNPADVLPGWHECSDPGHDSDASCYECEDRVAAEDLAADLREHIAKRKLLNKLIRKHGANGRFRVVLDNGELWHTVQRGEVRYLARVLRVVNQGSIPSGEEWTAAQAAEANELQQAGFGTA